MDNTEVMKLMAAYRKSQAHVKALTTKNIQLMNMVNGLFEENGLYILEALGRKQEYLQRF